MNQFEARRQSLLRVRSWADFRSARIPVETDAGFKQRRASRSAARSVVETGFALVTLLASVAFSAPAQSTGDQAALGYPDLMAKANAEGSVRVIVGMPTAQEFLPEGYLVDGEAVEGQRDAIAMAQLAILDNLSTYDVTVNAVYGVVPYIALTVDLEALDFLVASTIFGQVTSIQEDVADSATLASSIPIVGVNEAWARGFDGSGQAIAILDAGVEKNHSFLGGASSRVVSEACYSSYYSPHAAVSLCPNGSEIQIGPGSADPNTAQCFSGSGTTGNHLCEHGTHVAGIAAGAGSSFSGVARSANIIAIQVFSRFNSTVHCAPETAPCARTYLSDQMSGLERVYALRNTHDIAAANMSIGGGRFTSPCDTHSLKAIIDTLRSVGIATVVSSGNDGYPNALGAPACISSAISVGATSDSDYRAYFSNVASFLDLFAPGVNITSSVPSNGFETWDGTSMAAPHVAGSWAILKQASPSATVAQVLSALSSTGVPITTHGITKPRIQVETALDSMAPLLTVSRVGSGSGTVTSSPSGISCGADCEHRYPVGQVVSLVASPLAGSAFAGWSGHPDCLDGHVTMSADRACTASFELLCMLTIEKTGSGTGTVTTAPPGISCEPDCQELFIYGTAVQIFGTPALGSELRSWDGHGDCTDGAVAMDADKTCLATFGPCSINSEVNLTPQTVETSQSFEACNILRAGTGDFRVAETGDVTFSAGNIIELHSGFSVADGGQFAVIVGAPMVGGTTLDLQNGDFESGQASWTEFSSSGLVLILSSASLPVTPHGGSWAARLGGANDETAYIEQRVTIPAATPYLTYWHWIDSDDLCGFDFAEVVVDLSTVETYDLCITANTDGWTQHSVDLSAYASSTVNLQIRVETDSVLSSDLFADDVSFAASP